MATTITANGINFPDGSASAPSIGGTDTNTGLFTGSDIVGFATGGVERIRIDANGKVCINNDNALSDLHICTAGSSEEDGTLRLGGSAASLGLVLDYDQSSATVSRITANPTYNNNSSLLKICVDGDANPNQLVLTGAGRVGIGIADNTSTDLQVVGTSSSGSIRVGGNNGSGVGLDISYDNSSTTQTTFKQNYRATNAGALIKFDSGYFTFHTGTAGGEKLRIDTSGRLLINASATRASAGGNPMLQIEKNSSELATFLRTDNGNGAAWLALAKSRSSAGAACQAGDNIGAIAFIPHDGTDLNHHAAEIRSYVDTGIGTNDTPGYLTFHTNPGQTTTNERLRITSAGLVGIGVTDPSPYYSRNLVIATAASGGITLASNGAHTNYFMFADGSTGSDRYAGYIGYSHSTDTFVIRGCGNGTKGVDIESDGDLNIIDGNLAVANGHGIDFSANSHESSMSSELFDGYEEGTFTPTIWKGGTQSSLTVSYGKYIKVGKAVHFSFYCFRNWDSSGLSNGTETWRVGFPFTVIGGNNSGYQFFPAGYCRVNSAGPTSDQQARWQANSTTGTKLFLYSSNNNTNWTSGYIEFSGSGTAYLN